MCSMALFEVLWPLVVLGLKPPCFLLPGFSRKGDSVVRPPLDRDLHA